MRKIENIVVHCTGTTQHSNVEAIKTYWLKFLGWKSPGYHYLIDIHGNIHHLHPESLVANGAYGFNHNSVHVGYIGGTSKKGIFMDTRTTEQKQAMFMLLYCIKTRYPTANILGHRNLKGHNKACPCFDAQKEYKNLNAYVRTP